MTITQEIAYWKQCAAEAKTDKAAVLAQGVAIGLQIAKNDYVKKQK